MEGVSGCWTGVWVLDEVVVVVEVGWVDALLLSCDSLVVVGECGDSICCWLLTACSSSCDCDCCNSSSTITLPQSSSTASTSSPAFVSPSSSSFAAGGGIGSGLFGSAGPSTVSALNSLAGTERLLECRCDGDESSRLRLPRDEAAGEERCSDEPANGLTQPTVEAQHRQRPTATEMRVGLKATEDHIKQDIQ